MILTGEMIVTVGDSKEVGGRNQEFCAAIADRIRGSRRIVAAAVDTDGTDGPGGFSQKGAPTCLAGGCVDGYTVNEFEKAGFDIRQVLKKHGTSKALWNTGNGIHAIQGISVNDLVVILIQGE